jgi:DNA-binding transcriptional ArsR family regulator
MIQWTSATFHKDLFNILIGRPGGYTSMIILDEILKKPQNANQLAKALGYDYKTIRYHLKIFCNHNYVEKEKLNSYTYYFPSEKLIKNLDEYKLIKENYSKLVDGNDYERNF